MITSTSRKSFRHHVSGTSLVGFASCLIACGGGNPEGASPDLAATAAIAVAAPGTASASSFTATMSGDVAMELEGQDVGAGVKYKRYHINMVSKDPNGVLPPVVIAFGNTDTIAPSMGTYTLAGKDGFRGSVEIYSQPQRDFQITSGELIITDAKGGVISGSFRLSAKETPEEYGDPAGMVRVEGSFVSRPARN